MTERLTPDLEKTLRGYALGDVQDELRSELEELLVTDPDAFEALGVVEDELIEEYLDDALTKADRLAFERHFLMSPRREERLRFVRVLRSRATLGSKAPATRAEVQARWQPAWLGLAAALAASLVGNVWLATRQPVKPDAAGLRAAVAQLEPSPSPPPVVGAAVSEAEDVRAVLQREREERLQAEAMVDELQKELRRSPGLRRRGGGETALPAGLRGQRQVGGDWPTDRGPSVAPLATFALASGVLRSAGSMQRVSLPAGEVAVRLRLQLSEDDYPLYRAALVDAEGEELWSASKLRSEADGDARAVVLILSATLLAGGDYQVKLQGRAEREGLEAVGTYVFRVSAP